MEKLSRRIILQTAPLPSGVSTRRLNEQLKRNYDRFPPDLAFQLTQEERAFVKSHAAEISRRTVAFCDRSRKAPRPPLPFSRLYRSWGAKPANLLKSPQAAQMSLQTFSLCGPGKASIIRIIVAIKRRRQPGVVADNLGVIRTV
jgi:hypothetical protein